MNYCKITAQNQPMMMPNPYRTVIANPTDEKKALIAQLDNWLEMVYTEQPTYDPETQYITDSWSEIDGKAVQSWTIYELPPEPQPIEEHLDEVDAQATYTALETDTLLGE